MDYPVQRLLKFDIVITSHNFLRQRFIEKIEFEEAVNMAHAFSPDQARSWYGKQLRPPPLPLHSPLYEQLDRKIAVLIVDESQDAKHPKSGLLAALRALNPLSAFVLSGTPVHNRWDDLYGQMSILPGCPFESFEHFNTTFGSDDRGHINGARMLLLKRLMSGLLVTRPKGVLSLPGIKKEVVHIDLDWDSHPEELLIISRVVATGRRFLWKSRASPNDHSRWLGRAFGLFSKAQSYSANPLLSSGVKILQGDEKYADDYAALSSALRKFLIKHQLPLDKGLRDLPQTF